MNFFNFKKNYYKYFLFFIFTLKIFGSEIDDCDFCKKTKNEFKIFNKNSKSIIEILEYDKVNNFDYFSNNFSKNLINFNMNLNFNLCEKSEKTNEYYFYFLKKNEKDTIEKLKNFNSLLSDFISENNINKLNEINEIKNNIKIFLDNNNKKKLIKNYIILYCIFLEKLNDEEINFCEIFKKDEYKKKFKKTKENLKNFLKNQKEELKIGYIKNSILNEKNNLLSEIKRTIKLPIEYSSENNSNIMITKLQNKKPFLKEYFYKNQKNKKIIFEYKYKEWNYNKFNYDLKKIGIEIKTDKLKKIIFPDCYYGLTIPTEIYFNTKKIFYKFLIKILESKIMINEIKKFLKKY